jgi:hypothetical protein
MPYARKTNFRSTNNYRTLKRTVNKKYAPRRIGSSYTKRTGTTIYRRPAANIRRPASQISTGQFQKLTEIGGIQWHTNLSRGRQLQVKRAQSESLSTGPTTAFATIRNVFNLRYLSSSSTSGTVEFKLPHNWLIEDSQQRTVHSRWKHCILKSMKLHIEVAQQYLPVINDSGDAGFDTQNIGVNAGLVYAYFQRTERPSRFPFTKQAWSEWPGVKLVGKEKGAWFSTKLPDGWPANAGLIQLNATAHQSDNWNEWNLAMVQVCTVCEAPMNGSPARLRRPRHPTPRHP